MNYGELNQDDDTFFAKVQPSLSAGQYTGYDMATITNGVDFDKFRELGPVRAARPRVPQELREVCGSLVQALGVRPGNVYSVPWQSGITGIAYNSKKVPQPLTSSDLWNPALKGKVGMFADNEDLPNAVLVAMYGRSPRKDHGVAVEAGRRQAHPTAQVGHRPQVLRPGLHRRPVEGATSGRVRPGPVTSSRRWPPGPRDLVFITPKEGGVLWTDNLVLLEEHQEPGLHR